MRKNFFLNFLFFNRAWLLNSLGMRRPLEVLMFLASLDTFDQEKKNLFFSFLFFWYGKKEEDSAGERTGIVVMTWNLALNSVDQCAFGVAR